MSATEITVIGNVVTAPSSNRTPSGKKVTNFRLASTERRYDNASQGWIDGNTFWVDVECWGDLSGNVSQSIAKGDPVVVVGTISTHEWEGEQGRRNRPQIKAEAVAPNLARGTAEFKRTQKASTDAPQADEPPTDFASDDEAQAEHEAQAEAEFVVGRDYVPDLSGLGELSEPALR